MKWAPALDVTGCMQVTVPQGYTGLVTVSLLGYADIQPLQYEVVSRSLQLQSLGFSICPTSFGILL
jgi:hypothetical protein